MANTSSAHSTAGRGRRVVRVQIEAVAVHPSASLEDQAAARRWLAGSSGQHAQLFPHLAWTPAIEQRCREQCARAFAALLGLAAPKAASPLKVERCSSCGSAVEQDAAGPCCSGAVIEPGTQRSARDVIGLLQVTGETITSAQIGQVHTALSGYDLVLLDTRQRVLLAACERLMPAGMTEVTGRALSLAELGAVAEMGLDACRELVAGAWNTAIASMQVSS